jgi:hypothetical protein
VGEIRVPVIDSWEIPAPVRRWSAAFCRMFMPVVKRTIFLAVLEYLQYSDTEKCRKTAKKRTTGKYPLFLDFHSVYLAYINL